MEQFNKNQEVMVKSNCQGRLHFRSKKTGAYVDWAELGTVQIMTLDDLLDMRNSQRQFFIENWIVVAEDNADEIYKYLRVDDLYKNVIDVQRYMKTVSKKSPATINKELANAPKSIKRTIANCAFDTYKSGKLDSLKVIQAIEESTGYKIRDIE